ncbi:MAG: MBOAT family protein [Desulfobacteraceae bacterium]|nr:MBOAT family protein [Desulfobacteraceae bacterium]
MIFSSIIFLFFFLPLALIFYLVPSRRWRNFYFLLASFVFYAWTEGAYTLILLASILCNYLLGRAIGPEDVADPLSATRRRRKPILALGISFNILLLALFKYTNFLAENLNHLLVWSGGDSLKIPGMYAPIGISFFTFHAISYLVDVYRGDAPAQAGPGALSTYMAAFPKVLAGPIVQYRQAAGQLYERTVSSAGFVTGIERFITGLAKKVLLATPLATVADAAFALQPDPLNPFSAWAGILCDTLQIYIDFSGYSDMAIGLGKMFGFDFPENFNFPYIAQSVRDFWQRWHMSLSLWFRQYLYIPLGGNRSTPGRTYFNLVAVFLLCGLWHGASWNFLIWGAWYGMFLVLERTAFGGWITSSWRPVRHAYLLLVVIVGWVFFRADDLASALLYLKAMFGLHWGSEPARFSVYLTNEVLFLFLAGIVFSMPVSKRIAELFEKPVGAVPAFAGIGFCLYTVFLSALFAASALSMAAGTHKAFIYFKF